MVKLIELWSADGWKKARETAMAEANGADIARVLSELRS